MTYCKWGKVPEISQFVTRNCLITFQMVRSAENMSMFLRNVKGPVSFNAGYRGGVKFYKIPKKILYPMKFRQNIFAPPPPLSFSFLQKI